MIWHWPQITLATLMVLNLGIVMARFGQPKRDSYDCIDLFVGPAITAALLYFGGFWTGGAP